MIGMTLVRKIPLMQARAPGTGVLTARASSRATSVMSAVEVAI